MADPRQSQNHPDASVTTQFTEDKIADKPYPCERLSCSTVIQPGQPRLYFAPVAGSNTSGRFVCEACSQHYLRSHATLSREDRTFGSISPVDLAAIRSQVNESQRQGAHTPQGRVSALSATSLSTTTPTTPQALLDSVNLIQRFYQASQLASQLGQTSSTPLPSAVVAASMAPPAIGYSPAHTQYSNQLQRWAAAAYKAPPAPSSRPSGQLPMRVQERREIRIVCQLVFDRASGKVEKTSFREGASVLYEISPIDLISVVKEALCTHATSLAPGFPWDFSKMIVREVTPWQDVSKVDLTEPYFKGRFIKEKNATAKSNGPIISFTPPRTPIEFYLIVNSEQYLAYDQYIEDAALLLRPATPPARVSGAGLSLSKQKRKSPPSPEVQPIAQPPLPSKKANTRSTSNPLSTSTQTISSSLSASFSSQTPNNHIIPSTTRSLSSAMSGVVLNTKFPSASASSGAFQRLNRDQIRQGILLGGQDVILERKKEFDVIISERVTCFLVNTILFADLCSESKYQLINNSKPYHGYITYRKDQIIGTGSFKTANLASLKVPGLDLGVIIGDSISIVLKRPYTTGRAGQGIKRFNYTDESRKVMTECTLLGWADSLLRFAYSYLDSVLTDITASSNQPIQIPLIPQLRFVKAAIAYAEKPLDGAAASSSTSHRAAYLLEEQIPGFDFIKYIHNADAVPLLDPGEPGYDVAVFLCFIQHVQYLITEEQAYLSDFQGAGLLLTDPQVMTRPSLEGEAPFGTLLFGEGNVNSAFDAFTSQHQCNMYCTFFKLSPLCNNEGSKGKERSRVDTD